jgi:hypothetical protein
MKSSELCLPSRPGAGCPHSSPALHPGGLNKQKAGPVAGKRGPRTEAGRRRGRSHFLKQRCAVSSEEERAHATQAKSGDTLHSQSE